MPSWGRPENGGEKKGDEEEMTSGASSGFKKLFEQIGVSAVVSMLVSGLISGATLVYFESRLTRSTERAHEIIYMQQQIDGAQSNLVGRFGGYTSNIWDTKAVDPIKRDELLKAITDTELQILRMRDRLPASGQTTLKEYNAELDAFTKTLREVKSPQDLGAAYESFQHLLAAHRKLDAELAEQNVISAF